MLSHDDRCAVRTLPIRHIILFLPTSNRNECNSAMLSVKTCAHFVLCSYFVGLLSVSPFYHPDDLSVRSTQEPEGSPIALPITFL